MDSRTGFGRIVALALGAAILTASPAFARGGSGGHGGPGGHGAFGGHGGSGGHAGAAIRSGGVRTSIVVAVRPAGIVIARGRAGQRLITSRPSAAGAFGSPIRPVVIAVSPPLVPGFAVAPFNGPIVAPLAASQPAGSVLGGLPIVTTPGGAAWLLAETPLIASEPAGTPARAVAVSTRDSSSGSAPDPHMHTTGLTPLDTPLGACRLMPFGYHCDWPSQPNVRNAALAAGG